MDRSTPAELTSDLGNRSSAGRRRGLLFLSILLYAAACALPALRLHTGGNVYGKDLQPSWRWTGYESVRGLQLLFAGWFGLMFANFAVLANPALWLAWFLLAVRQPRRAFTAAAAAMLLAMFTFLLAARPYYFDEAGARQGYLGSLDIGFFCWIASMAVILLSRLQQRAETGTEP